MSESRHTWSMAYCARMYLLTLLITVPLAFADDPVVTGPEAQRLLSRLAAEQEAYRKSLGIFSVTFEQVTEHGKAGDSNASMRRLTIRETYSSANSWIIEAKSTQNSTSRASDKARPGVLQADGIDLQVVMNAEYILFRGYDSQLAHLFEHTSPNNPSAAGEKERQRAFRYSAMIYAFGDGGIDLATISLLIAANRTKLEIVTSENNQYTVKIFESSATPTTILTIDGSRGFLVTSSKEFYRKHLERESSVEIGEVSPGVWLPTKITVTMSPSVEGKGKPPRAGMSTSTLVSHETKIAPEKVEFTWRGIGMSDGNAISRLSALQEGTLCFIRGTELVPQSNMRKE